MSLIVKICGLSEPRSLDAALAAGADMVGFVFFPKSPRHLDLATARTLGVQVQDRAKKVALTVDADDPALAAIVEALEPDILQLHGDEAPERVRDVREKFGLPVMKAVGLAARDDMARIAAYDGIADYLLFDARAPDDADRPGGNGEPFDWTLLRGMTTQRPWLLAGGLNPDNVEKALRETGAPGLDVSSGVESSPGVKDADRITRFLALARLSRTVPDGVATQHGTPILL